MADDLPDRAMVRALLAIHEALRESALDGVERRLLAVGLLLMNRLSGEPDAAWRRTAADPAGLLLDTIDALRSRDGRTDEAWNELADALARAQRTHPQNVLAACLDRLADLPWIASRPLDGAGASADLFMEELAENDPRLAVLPREVAELMVRLAGVEPAHRVLDPCCGTGTLLIHAARHATGGAAAGRTPAARVGLYGQEAHASIHATAQLGLRLHGLADAELRHGDALGNPAFLSDDGRRVTTFDRVITAPPLSARWKPPAEADAFRQFPHGRPAPHSADFAYLQHAAASLAPGGRAVVLMPPGILYRGGKEGRIRAAMVEAGLFEAVIALPRKLLFGTRSPGVLVVLSRREPHPEQTVRFVDASSWPGEGRGRNRLPGEDAERILSLCADPAPASEYAAVVQVARLRRAGHDLNIAQWVVPAQTEVRVDLRQEIRELRDVERQRDDAARALDELLERLLEQEGGA